MYDIVLMPREFLSTLSLRRATVELTTLVNKLFISIHALLAESDFRLFFIVFDLFRFLSTLSLRRATNLHPGYRAFIHYFYPRSPCGERLGLSYFYIIKITHFYPRSPCGERPIRKCQIVPIIQISIHALLAESDNRRPIFFEQAGEFLSTLSLRRATQKQNAQQT